MRRGPGENAMTCPLCSAQAKDGATECPSCGAIFAKLRERDKKKAEPVLSAGEPALSVAPWKLRLGAALFVAAWLIAFGVFACSRRKNAPPESPAKPAEFKPDAPPPPGLPPRDPDFDD